ncbi:hypothetical protein [Rhodopseudomonas pseudopalustris]|uniref:Uncharacterized protein n=1 Tax=Rhodopseudomonas pseudopalustris TaxID=1513892 RepID=A0A1H8QPP4_9BRAD|nr:hypothetical protein [Rhodopseudomonas pseudopalustris]SEO56189.1 hypothetical protein SAMN05444123_103306 [Rhodopseudomonas pseudopalustris]
MRKLDPASAADATRPEIPELAARQAVCAALALGILAIAARLAMIW